MKKNREWTLAPFNELLEKSKGSLDVSTKKESKGGPCDNLNESSKEQWGGLWIFKRTVKKRETLGFLKGNP